MALHFERKEFGERFSRLQAAMGARELDCLLLFSQESMYWLTGYDTFGYAFFQCLVVKPDGEMVLLTRSADLRQARHTSILENIVLWTDRQGAEPTGDLLDLLSELDLVGAKIGVEYASTGLTGEHAIALKDRLTRFAEGEDASDIVNDLRSVKSESELAHVRQAAKLTDDALDEAIRLAKPGVSEGEILAAMHHTIFAQGGDYAGNEFIIGSGSDALLCRYKSGRRTLDQNDQLTLEWSGAWAHYHAAMMRTLIIGEPKPRHQELYQAAKEALLAVQEAMQIGNSFGDLFDAHARTFDALGLSRHRLNACGYSLGATFTPCWMDKPMMFAGNERTIDKNMVLFVHMILFDSTDETAMTLGESYITRADGPERLSRHDIDLILCS